MKNSLQPWILLVWLAALLGLVGCAAEGATPTPTPSGPRDALYARWVYQDEKGMAELVFDFQRGGKLLLGSEGVYLETTFEFVDDETILVAQGSAEPIRMTWRVEGDSLTLTSGDEVQVLQRRDQ